MLPVRESYVITFVTNGSNCKRVEEGEGAQSDLDREGWGGGTCMTNNI